MTRVSVVVVLVFSVFGCNHGMLDPNGSVAVQTDKTTYAVNEPISISLHNGTGRTAFFRHCGLRISFSLLQNDGTVWQVKQTFGETCAAVLPSGTMGMECTRLYTDRISLGEGGRYCLRFAYGMRQDNPSADYVVSNEFTVR